MKEVLRKIAVFICSCVMVVGLGILGYRGYFILKDKLNTDEYEKIRDSIADELESDDLSEYSSESLPEIVNYNDEYEEITESEIVDSVFESEETRETEKQEESVVLKYALGKIKGNSKEKDIPKKYLKELKTDRTPMALRYSRRLMRKLRAKYKNKDIIGYIKLINKDLEYPIVQGETNETYLHAGPDGSYDYNGSIFLDYGNTEDFLDTRSVLYGHNMRNGSMFGSLRNFYSESIDDSYFLIYSDYGIYVYKIVCFATINAFGGNYYCHPEKQYKKSLMSGEWDRREDDPDKNREINVERIGIFTEEEAEIISSYDAGLEEFYNKIKDKAMLFDESFKYSPVNKYMTLMTCFGDGKTERLAVTGYLVYR